MIVCKICGIELTETTWPVYLQKSHHYTCKYCESERHKKQYRANRDYFNNRSKERYQTKRNKVLQHYTKGEMKCACCGESKVEFLSIDHIHENGAEHRRNDPSARHGLYNWLITNEYPEGFQVLCMNCNMAKSIYGVCPHQKEKI